MAVDVQLTIVFILLMVLLILFNILVKFLVKGTFKIIKIISSSEPIGLRQLLESGDLSPMADV